MLALGACGGDADSPDGPSTGSTEVTPSTSGEDLDPDGYDGQVDGVSEGGIGVNDTQTFPGIDEGTRTA